MILDIFKTSVFLKTIKNDNYVNYFLSLLKTEKSKNKSKGKIFSSVGGFQTRSFTSIDNEDILYNVFLNPVFEFAQQLNPKKETKLTLDNFWINSNSKNSYNSLHNHDGIFSGVYYIKVPKDSGRLVFQNGDLTKISNHHYEIFQNENFSSKYYCNVEKYQLYLFTSPTLHFVEPNNSDEERISVAFNIKII